MSAPRDAAATPVRTLTKIVATLGPATDDERILERLVEHGASVFRLNFSHGDLEAHGRRLRAVRAIERRSGAPLGVIADLPGPKIRVGQVPPGPEGPAIEVEAGQDVILRGGAKECIRGSPVVLACSYPRLAQEVKPGERVLINDGAVRMLAVSARGDSLECRVVTGGPVTTGKGVNLPDSELTLPSTTDRDLEAADWAVREGVDYLALSFVRRAGELRTVAERLRSACAIGPGGGGRAPQAALIAKIETPQAVSHIDEILAESDGVMIARGDLGVEMEIARVPMIQKSVMRRAQEFGRPCIVATQMLESMIAHDTPTRAEVSDVANAILDGADAVMLSGETAVGKYPALAVEVIRRVALETEGVMREGWKESVPAADTARPRDTRLDALAHDARRMALDFGAAIIAVWSEDGAAALALGRGAPALPIVAFSTDERACRRMAMLVGVHPVLARETPAHRSDFARLADEYILKHGLAARGVPAMLLGGKPLDDPRATNTVAIRTIGELIADE